MMMTPSASTAFKNMPIFGEKLRAKILFCDMWSDFSLEKSVLNSALRDIGVEVEVVDHDPSYVIFSDFGCENYKYDSCIKIYITGENSTPDFNLCDYAVSYSPINFRDRHFQQSVIEQPLPALPADRAIDLVSKPRRFCNFIYGNSHAGTADPTREHFFESLSNYKKIDAPGNSKNNMPNPIPLAAGIGAKIDFMRNYKFSIAFENSSQPGYTTEKLIHAFVADTIPIYWGNPDVSRFFNPGSFVNCHEFPDFAAVVEYIKLIDERNDIYLSYLTSPRTRGLGYSRKQAFREFLAPIFYNSPGDAMRRTLYGRQGLMPPQRERSATRCM